MSRRGSSAVSATASSASDRAVTAAHFFTDHVDGDTIRITSDDAHHAVRALRIRPGEEITVSDGRGTVARARCTEVSPRLLIAEILARDHVEQRRKLVHVGGTCLVCGELRLGVGRGRGLLGDHDGHDVVDPAGAVVDEEHASDGALPIEGLRSGPRGRGEEQDPRGD